MKNIVQSSQDTTMRIGADEFSASSIVLVAAVLLSFLVSYAALYWFKNDVPVATLLGKEDGVVEYLGALGFFFASMAFLAAYLSSRTLAEGILVRGNAFYLLFAVMFFFAAGEEISWGQRIFGLELPESIRSMNNKGEINIHNLTPFSRTNDDGIGWGFSRLFSIFVLLYCVLTPVVYRLSSGARNILNRVQVPIVPLWLGGICIANYLVSMWMKSVEADANMHVYAIEVKEMNFAIIFLAFGLYCYKLSRNRQTMTSPPELE